MADATATIPDSAATQAPASVAPQLAEGAPQPSEGGAPPPPTEGGAPPPPAESAAPAAPSIMSSGQQDASVAFVTQTYTNYVNDIQNAVEGLRQRAVALQQEAPAQLQQIQSQIQPQTQELVETLQDTQAPITFPTGQVVEIFGWTSILLLSQGIAGIFGGYLLSPFLGIFLGRFGAALIASIGLPIAASYYLKDSDGSTSETRFQLLVLSLAQGALLGHALAYTYVAGQPLGFLTPLTIAFAYPLVAGQVGTARTPLLGGALGASFGVQFVYGLLSGSLSFSFLLLAILYTAVAGATLQIAFKHLPAPSKAHFYQLLLVGGFLFSKALVYGLLGGEEAPKSR